MKKKYLLFCLLGTLLCSCTTADLSESLSSSSANSSSSSSSSTSSSESSSSSSTTSSSQNSSSSLGNSSSSISSLSSNSEENSSQDSSSSVNSSSSEPTVDLTKIDELINFIDSKSQNEVQDVAKIEYEKDYLKYDGYSEYYLDKGTYVSYDDRHITNEYSSNKKDDYSTDKTTTMKKYLGLWSEKENTFYDITVDSSEEKPTFKSYVVVDEVSDEQKQIASSQVDEKLSFNAFSEFKGFLNDSVKASGGTITKDAENPNKFLLQNIEYTKDNSSYPENPDKLECSFEFTLDDSQNVTFLTYHFKQQQYRAYYETYNEIVRYTYKFNFTYGDKSASSSSTIKPSDFIATSFDLQLEMGDYSFTEVDKDKLVVGNKVRGVAKNVIPATACDTTLTIKSSTNEDVVDLYGNINKSGTTQLTFVSEGGIEKQVDVTAIAPQADWISISLKNNHKDIYEQNEKIEFSFYWTPEESEDEFVVSVTLPGGTSQTLTAGDDNYYSIDASVVGKYTIKVEDKSTEGITATKDVMVIEPLTDDKIKTMLTSGVSYTCEIYDYYEGNKLYTLTFEESGSAKITSVGTDYWGDVQGEPSEIASFSYNVQDKQITLTFPFTINGDEYTSGTVTFDTSLSGDEVKITSIKFNLKQSSGYSTFSKEFKLKAE